jgi:hypothetical protein
MLAVSVPGVLFVVTITGTCLGLISWLLAGSRVTVARRAPEEAAPTAPATAGSDAAASVIDLRAPTRDATREHRGR